MPSLYPSPSFSATPWFGLGSYNRSYHNFDLCIDKNDITAEHFIF